MPAKQATFGCAIKSGMLALMCMVTSIGWQVTYLSLYRNTPNMPERCETNTGSMKRYVWRSTFWQQVASDFQPWDAFGITINDLELSQVRNPTNMVLIEDGKLSITDGVSYKHKMWVEPLKELLSTRRLPNVLFRITFGSLPRESRRDLSRANITLRAPLLAMAKTDDHEDVLYPNPYFTGYLKLRQDLLKLAEFPWTQRKPVAFWRGQCRRYPGSVPRSDLVRTMATSSIADVALTKPCPKELWPTDKQDTLLPLRRTKRASFKHMASFK